MIQTPYNIQIDFTVIHKTENDAIFELQKFIKEAIVAFGMESMIVEHEVMEFISDEQQHPGEIVRAGYYT